MSHKGLNNNNANFLFPLLPKYIKMRVGLDQFQNK